MTRTYVEFRKLIAHAIKSLIELAEMDHHPILIEMALTGKFTPMDFIVAARNIYGYDEKQAPNLEAQYFNERGWPMTDEEVLAKQEKWEPYISVEDGKHIQRYRKMEQTA